MPFRGLSLVSVISFQICNDGDVVASTWGLPLDRQLAICQYLPYYMLASVVKRTCGCAADRNFSWFSSYYIHAFSVFPRAFWINTICKIISIHSFRIPGLFITSITRLQSLRLSLVVLHRRWRPELVVSPCGRHSTNLCRTALHFNVVIPLSRYFLWWKSGHSHDKMRIAWDAMRNSWQLQMYKWMQTAKMRIIMKTNYSGTAEKWLCMIL